MKHFITSTWKSHQNNILIYDSLTMLLTWQLKLQLWRLYAQGTDEVEIQNLPVQHQQNGVDHGVFAAFAVELATERDPTLTSFSGSELGLWMEDSSYRGRCVELVREPCGYRHGDAREISTRS